MIAETTGAEPEKPVAHCQDAMNAWCNTFTNIPGSFYNASQCDAECSEVLDRNHYFTAKLIENEYHCVRDLEVENGRKPCLCSRDAELRKVLCDCDSTKCAAFLSPPDQPDDPPVGAGDCIRDLGNSTRLYNVAIDPGE